MHSIYQQQIMDHYHFPRHKGELQADDCLETTGANPSCGDQIKLFVRIKSGFVVDAKFNGIGCILTLAAADMLLEKIIGKSLDNIKTISVDDIKKMVGIEVGHTRIKCILLPFGALNDILTHA
ncbi:MAG: iron-sulfur cluster assembly scaffold protein [Candidatus Babeliaceae bacterium]|nr:iron-sulfur cluster assembly scaffold protein [Candidatus Babeliaceae bacterium]